MSRLLDNYNGEIDSGKKIEQINKSKDYIAWVGPLLSNFKKSRKLRYNSNRIRHNLYRPYIKTNLYYDRSIIHRPYQTHKIFPTPDIQNLAITVAGIGSQEFSCLIIDTIPCLDMVSKGQALPLKTYEKTSDKGELFQQATVEDEYEEETESATKALHIPICLLG